MNENLTRRKFLAAVSMLAAGCSVSSPSHLMPAPDKKLQVVLIGTGVRGTSFWGRRLVEQYPDLIEFVGLSDINPGRLKYAKEYMGVNCPVYTNFDEMMVKTKPDLVIVTTKDSTHHEFIIKGLDAGCDVLTEKPLTTDEQKCQAIIDAEKRSNKTLIVGFNYRWSPYMTKIKELLSQRTIGKITSVDFHWYLNTSHGASYFRRWHGQMDSGGSLLVHKATHHFDLLNWWIDSDPSEVFAYGALEHYGSNGQFRGRNCRNCQHKQECKFHWDITKSKRNMNLYVDHEHHDGYIRDNCLFRNEIDIYDKMSAQIKYVNNVVVNYSLTTYSPYEGWKIAFNGIDGRIEAWLDIPYYENMSVNQEDLHALEMSQEGTVSMASKPIIVHKNWESHKTMNVTYDRAGHGGGDQRLQDKIFKNADYPDPLKHSAGLRDGAMSILIGVAARKSIESGKVTKIKDLTDLEPQLHRV